MNLYKGIHTKSNIRLKTSKKQNKTKKPPIIISSSFVLPSKWEESWWKKGQTIRNLSHKPMNAEDLTKKGEIVLLVLI